MNDIFLIPQTINCPNCNEKYHLLELGGVSIFKMNRKCRRCDYIFTSEYIGKFFGVIKDVGDTETHS